MNLLMKNQKINQWFDGVEEGKRFLYFFFFIAVPMGLLLEFFKPVGALFILVVFGSRWLYFMFYRKN